MASGTGETTWLGWIKGYNRLRRRKNEVYENLINNEYRIVLVGTAGNGKSSTGNTLLDKTYFNALPSASAITVNCAKGEAEFYRKRVLVVDTPGYYDIERSEKDIHEEVKNCIGMIAPGPHIIVLVTTASGRFTREQHDTVQLVVGHFGEEALKYMMVLFTHIDCLGDTTFDQYIEKSPALLKKCSRCVTTTLSGFPTRLLVTKNWLKEMIFLEKLTKLCRKTVAHITLMSCYAR